MNDFFEKLEKYKFGLLAALLAYVIIFAYFQLGTYNGGGPPYSPFQEGARIEIPEDEIELLPENIMLPANFTQGEVKNAARDANDTRKRAEKDYSLNKSTFKGVQSATEYEKELFANAEGVEERKKIEKMIQDRQDREKKAEKNAPSKSDKTSTTGGESAAAGDVAVEFDLKNRTALKLPKPLYMCGVGASGRVVVKIKVDSGGNVISATHDPSKNKGNVVFCMTNTAETYAMKSKFSNSNSSSQEGTITYTFVSQ